MIRNRVSSRVVVILKIKRIKMCSLVVDCCDIIYMHSQTCRVGEGTNSSCVLGGGGGKERNWGGAVGIRMCYFV